MRIISITEPGGPEVLQLADAPTPEPGPGEVLIKVAASGVNRADIVQRQGFYPPPPGASPVPGLEAAGEIVAVGEAVSLWQSGDRVCALLSGGGYADHAVAAAEECLPIPESLSPQQAAALPETVLTVWSNVIDRAGLKHGETFLVHGGASGIGTTAIQLVKHYGCSVFTTVGSDEKADVCRQLGADVAINYRQQDFVEVLREATDGRGVDVILDMVGGDYLQRNVELAATGGRIVNIAYLHGATVEMNMLPLMLKRLILTGSTLRAREPAFKAALTASVREKVWPWVEQGTVLPVIHASLPAADVARAHQIMEASEHIGKIVLTWT
jgi:putative PIG3 family NAD(P)H quinone oxidoreductase